MRLLLLGHHGGHYEPHHIPFLANSLCGEDLLLQQPLARKAFIPLPFLNLGNLLPSKIGTNHLFLKANCLKVRFVNTVQ